MHQHNIEMFEHVQTLNWLVQACLQAVRAKFSHKVYNHKLPSPVTDFNKINVSIFLHLFYKTGFVSYVFLEILRGELAHRHPKLIPSLMPYI